MNEKKSKRLRQLVKHLIAKEVVENKPWVVYAVDMKYHEMEVPDTKAPTVFDENGKLITVMRKQLVATGSRSLDPKCGRAIYQAMKKREALAGIKQ
jgi:hypothetical protein